MDRKLINYFECSRKSQRVKYERLIEKELGKYQQASSSLSSPSTRKAANNLYSNKKFMKAKELYTKAIQAASHDSDDESYAFGNRSAVSFELQEYQVCLVDIENALCFNGCPSFLRSKLLLRRLDCYISLRDHESAQRVMDLIGMSINTETIAAVETLKSARHSPVDKQSVENDKVYKENNAEIPGASSALRAINTPEAGRSLMARDDIPVGSVLIQEKPYVKVLLPDQWSQRCFHCITPLIPNITVFCRKRCKVNFCSRKCADDAWDQYHRYECPLLQLIVDTGLGHLAHRIVAFTGFNTIKDYKDGFNGEAVEAYTPVHKLVTNENSINETDLQYYMEATLLLVMVLMKIGYFPESVQTLDDPGVLLVATTLLHHLVQLICNAYAITYLEECETHANSTVVTREQVNIASAIYPATSLLNHSCKPNVSVSFKGEYVVVKSQTSIKQGEEVFNCYGPHYMKMDVEDRRAALQQQYHFYCRCTACDNDDSKSSEIFSCPKACGFPAVSQKDIIKCTHCAAEHGNKSYLEAKQLALEAVNTEDEPASQLVRIKYALQREELYEFGILRARLYDRLSLQYSLLGKMKLCAENAEKAVYILIKNYGEDAIEMAEEYHKLATIYQQAGDLMMTGKYAFKALPIYEQFYHSSHESVREIISLCGQLSRLRAA